MPSDAYRYCAERFGLTEREVRLALSVFNGDKLLKTHKNAARTFGVAYRPLVSRARPR
jgi:hypothetical protein